MNPQEEHDVLKGIYSGLLRKNSEIRLKIGLQPLSNELIFKSQDIHKKNQELVENIRTLIKENNKLNS